MVIFSNLTNLFQSHRKHYKTVLMGLVLNHMTHGGGMNYSLVCRFLSWLRKLLENFRGSSGNTYSAKMFFRGRKIISKKNFFQVTLVIICKAPTCYFMHLWALWHLCQVECAVNLSDEALIPRGISMVLCGLDCTSFVPLLLWTKVSSKWIIVTICKCRSNFKVQHTLAHSS